MQFQINIAINKFKKLLDKALFFCYNYFANATMAQLVEHILGKDEVIGSIPISSSKCLTRASGVFVFKKKTRRSACFASKIKVVGDRKLSIQLFL